MRTLVTLRPPGGDEVVLVAEDGRWTDPDDGPVDEAYETHELWALPGLADAHAHLAADEMRLDPGDPDDIRRRAYACIQAGVFLTLDKGWGDDAVLCLFDEPPDRRPDLEAAGRMIAAPGGYYPGFAEEVDEDELEAAVARAAARRGGWVKIVGDWPRRGEGPRANFTAEGLAAAVRVAHRAGARVAIHTMAREAPTMAVAAGVDSIEHGLFLTEDDLASLAARGGMWVPTLLRMESVRDELREGGSGRRLLDEGLANAVSLLPVAEQLGVTVLAGSDLAVPARRVAAEAARLAEAGLSPEAAVAAVSVAAYQATGRDAGFRPGLSADAVFFDRDPREDLGVLERPVLVLRRGRRVVGD